MPGQVIAHNIRKHPQEIPVFFDVIKQFWLVLRCAKKLSGADGGVGGEYVDCGDDADNPATANHGFKPSEVYAEYFPRLDLRPGQVSFNEAVNTPGVVSP